MAGVKKGTVNNPSGKGGFGERPDDINKGGFTSKQRERHYEQHNKALALRDKQLDALSALADDLADAPDELVPAIVTAAANQIINDAIDRNAGKAKQSVDLSSADGSMSPKGRNLSDFYKDQDVPAKPEPE